MIRDAACLVTRGWMPRSERLGAFIREAVGLDKRGCMSWSVRRQTLIREVGCLDTRGFSPGSDRLKAMIGEGAYLDSRGCIP